MNLTQIATVAAGEAERQQVGLTGLADLLRAYEYAYSNSKLGLAPTKVSVHALGSLVEPSTYGQFRFTPVTFRNGGSSAHPERVSALMNSLFEYVPGPNNLEPYIYAWVKEFLWIHPFTDGNGRVAWILYNWLMNSLDSPVPLPEFGW
jgi:hypothetical protein